MELAGRSLSFRPLNINHEENRQLRFPENATLFMEFDPESMSVKGSFRVLDSTVNAMIETQRIKQVSIEQIPAKGESCNEITCEQHGVAFIGMALLESDVIPGDPQATIQMESVTAAAAANILLTTPLVHTESLSSILVSDGQRTCKECTDYTPCHTCKHQVEQGDDCVADAIRELNREKPNMSRDQKIAIALKKCGKSNQKEAWWWYRRITEKYPSWKK